MPWHIEKRKSKYCVINSDTGKNEGCSDSKEDAIAHKRVLYATKHGWKPTGKKS
jgi:hypothetical protein